jgi:hypothetical protein
MRMTLSEAVSGGRLPEFIAQEEARGIGPIDRAEFDGVVSELIKERRSEDQTSRSASDGNSSGKKTLRGTYPDASR